MFSKQINGENDIRKLNFTDTNKTKTDSEKLPKASISPRVNIPSAKSDPQIDSPSNTENPQSARGTAKKKKREKIFCSYQ